MDDWSSQKFAEKYELSKSDWGGHSGGGSTLYHSGPYRLFLESFIRNNRIQSVCDVGCGDWQFSRMIDFGAATYSGFDVVEEIVKNNERRFASPKCSFNLMPQLLTSIDGRDLLVIKDVLQHLSNDNIMKFVRELLPRFKFCLITNSFQKIHSAQNVDVLDGEFRCIDLSIAPFEVPGCYVLEFGSALWERLRTYLVCNV